MRSSFLSAHVDHIGIGEPIDGDRIYNGAMDNGSGSALLVDIAANLAASGRAAGGSPAEKPRRSILFTFVTAEEKGLLGSKYFAAHPTVDPKSIVADVNVDMFLPIVPLKVLKVEGIAESDLGDRAVAIAQSLGVKAIADPEPLRNGFIRSDQYSFIRHGIPALKMDVGSSPARPSKRFSRVAHQAIPRACRRPEPARRSRRRRPLRRDHSPASPRGRRRGCPAGLEAGLLLPPLRGRWELG